MLRCQYKRSDMTPCVIEDGPICYSDPLSPAVAVVCVGCERTIGAITEDLAARGEDPILPPGQSGGARGGTQR
jgi:hypothetical protein